MGRKHSCRDVPCSRKALGRDGAQTRWEEVLPHYSVLGHYEEGEYRRSILRPGRAAGHAFKEGQPHGHSAGPCQEGATADGAV